MNREKFIKVINGIIDIVDYDIVTEIELGMIKEQDNIDYSLYLNNLNNIVKIVIENIKTTKNVENLLLNK